MASPAAGPAMQRVLFSSKTHTWGTPAALFADLDREFHFTLDAAASQENALCAHFFSARDNALWQRWEGVVWCNPPYGSMLPRFMQKAYLSAQQGATVVCLVPARTDTRWWHNYAMQGEIRFIRGRLRFGTAANSAPFPSAIIVFRPAKETPDGR